MQKPKPTDAAGVEVVLSVIDANNNLREIGKAASDTTGFYSLKWTPDILGKYTVIATFAGSESYWPSSAETAFAVDEASPAPAEPEPEAPSFADQYFLPMSAGTIVATAIVGVTMVLLLRKRP